ncbi:hypothetical protein KC343_g15067 [Hortaea werneckii]|nr:hypothetical protein KC352_g27603 [Hortaea werneckii]KAI7547528.1 hypothetical protein KC317_g15095 [Hortaea werneckii]KAI7596833.1 hypothetical protein KC346_g14962 [Hortaea werneckii]KAI7601914.1 hypothetical protein KC343_g15067 [Hortaea werneckii]KAI7638543.1 hypothetical protein KC319_g14813 [Hortaea werneckii]
MLQLLQKKLKGILGRLRRQPVAPPRSPLPEMDEETPLIPKLQGVAEADTPNDSIMESLQQADDEASRLWHEVPAIPRY